MDVYLNKTADTIRVLHVDDEPEFVDMAATFLEREDSRIDVRTANSPADGLEILANYELDCIVSGYDVPQTNGIELLETVREVRKNACVNRECKTISRKREARTAC